MTYSMHDVDGSMTTHIQRICRVRALLTDFVNAYAHHCHVDVIGTANTVFVKLCANADSLSTVQVRLID